MTEYGLRVEPAVDSSGLSVTNPFCQRDSGQFFAFSVHRQRCLDLLLAWLASRDLRQPEMLGEAPPYELDEIIACCQVFTMLSRPKWLKADIAVLEEYFERAWRTELFGECAEESRHCIRAALAQAAEELSAFAGSRVTEESIDL